MEEIFSNLFAEFFPHFSISIWKGPMKFSERGGIFVLLYIRSSKGVTLLSLPSYFCLLGATYNVVFS